MVSNYHILSTLIYVSSFFFDANSHLTFHEQFVDLSTNGWQSDKVGRTSQLNVVEDVGLPGRRILETNISYCDDELCYRSELKTEPNRRSEILPSNEGEYWIGFSLQIPIDWEYLNDVYTSGTPFRTYLFQIHGGDNLGRPPIIGLRNEGYRLSVNICGNSVRSSPSKNCKYIAIGDVVVGEWEDWVIYNRMSHMLDGSVKIWRNGVVVLDISNIPTSFNDSSPHYIKIGTYVTTWKNSVDPAEVKTTWSGARISSFKLGNESSSYDEVKTSIYDVVPGYSSIPSSIPTGQPSTEPTTSKLPTALPTDQESIAESGSNNFFKKHSGTFLTGFVFMVSLLIILWGSWYAYSLLKGDEEYTTTPSEDRKIESARPIDRDNVPSIRSDSAYSNSYFSFSNIYGRRTNFDMDKSTQYSQY